MPSSTIVAAFFVISLPVAERIQLHGAADDIGTTGQRAARKIGQAHRGVQRRPGIGLQNVRRRLECYYGDRATLTLKRSATGETVAELTLPTLHAPGDDDAPDDHDAIGEGIGVGTVRHL